ncbi:MAG: ADP-ribosylglycohydrolase family protein [Gammaproteobacteria bacterium]|nr:ADP-ribosylglycohydrolase family protein [Gammaproteobacteria bacterium]MDE0248238.1 ADP-ribosylglycohydrolase family protein [Gammaproteobacteria bacterium]
MIGLLACESLPAALQGGRSGAGPDTRLAFTTADSVLPGVDDHPVRFAERLATTDICNGGMAAEQSQTSLIAGMRWWEAAASNSAGAAGAARSSPFGLLWAGDPERAAFEAALSATVTHGHQAAVAGAAALAGAIALAASGNGRLDRVWLTAVADICAGYPQRDVNGRTMAEVVRMGPDYLSREPDFEAYTCEGAGHDVFDLRAAVPRAVAFLARALGAGAAEASTATPLRAP